ncbi:teichoic acid transport system permease protein [Corynebacterium afermentans]
MDTSESTVSIDCSGLKPVLARPSMLAYIRRLWRFRTYFVEEARAGATQDNMSMALGRLWLVLDPLLQTLLYAIVFGLLMRSHRGIDNFIGFLIIGVTVFRTSTRGLSAGSGLLQRSKGMMSAFNFPSAGLAIGEALKIALRDSVPMVVAVAVAILLQPDPIGSVDVVLLTLIPLYFLLVVFVAGEILVVSRSTARVPDLKNLVSVGTRGLFFLSGIFYSIERFDHAPGLQRLMELNPIYQFLHAFRTIVLSSELPANWELMYVFGWSLGLFLFGLWFFWMKEGTYAGAR